MYIPGHFSETDLATLQQAIDDAPLGTLVLVGPSGLTANHVPFQLDAGHGPYGTLRCHVARANDVWKYADGAEGLVIFEGASAYISPSLYETKKENGKVVPTYNYVSVHAHGRIVVHEDHKWLRALVGHLTQKFEASRLDPWKMGDAPQDYLEQMLGKIVGLGIEITRLEGKWKMSQNRSDADKAGVVAGLKESPVASDREVARIVEERAKCEKR